MRAEALHRRRARRALPRFYRRSPAAGKKERPTARGVGSRAVRALRGMWLWASVRRRWAAASRDTGTVSASRTVGRSWTARPTPIGGFVRWWLR